MGQFGITFFGVGGSSAVGNPKRVRYGTNTSCALITAGDTNIILDMGTGLARLSQKREQYHLSNAYLLLSHFHYDHIEGTLFFQPFFQKGQFHLYGMPPKGESLGDVFSRYLATPFSPISSNSFLGEIQYHSLTKEDTFFLGQDIRVQTKKTNHPGDCLAYRIFYAGKTVVYLTDHEHQVENPHDFVDFCKNADVLIYDSYFTQEEYDTGAYNGWGHSTHTAGIALAKAAGVRCLVLSHHAIWRTDEELDQLGLALEKEFPNVSIAREDLRIEL